MTKSEFKETENKLYTFYKKDKIIDSIKFQINIIDKQIYTIKDKIKNIDVNIGDGLQGVSYGDKVQTSANGTSYAEQAIMRGIEQLEIELIRKKELKSKLEQKIRDIELDSSALEYNIQFLSERDKKFLKEKYKNYASDWKIAEELHISQPSAYRKKERLINKINRWIGWLN